MLLYRTGFLGRVLVFTLTYGLIGTIFPLQEVELTFTYVLGVLVTGFLYALLLGFVFTQMPVGRIGRILSVWIAIYVTQMFNPLIEGYFFTTQFENPTFFIGGAFIGAMLTFFYSFVGGILFAPKRITSSLAKEIRNHFGQRRASEWSLRLILAVLSWPFLYFIFGSMVEPIVLPYYTDPSLGYSLRFPSIETIIIIQALRGLIYIGALIPIIASLKVEMKKILLSIVGFLYIGGGLAIFVIVETFPVILRIVHGIEIFATSLFFGIIITYLLVRVAHPS